MSAPLLERPASAFTFAAAAAELEAAGRRIVHLELGEPGLPGPEAAVRALTAAATDGARYSPPAGDPGVRAAVAAHYTAVLRRPIGAEQVVLVPGSNMVLYFTLRALLVPGDEVLLPDPGFPPYAELVRLAGAVPVGYPLRASNGFVPHPAEVAGLVTARTRLLVLNSPHNPTGAVLPATVVTDLAALAAAHDLHVVADDAYRELRYTGVAASPLLGDAERTTVMDSLSKSHSMCGWRIGIAIAPPSLAARMTTLMTNTNCCMPTFVQQAIPAALAARAHVRGVTAQCRERRDLVVARLRDMPQLCLAPPGGAIYAFPDISGTGLGDAEFADRLLREAGVAVVPGGVYGRHGAGHVRIAFTRPPAELAEGMSLLRRFLEDL